MCRKTETGVGGRRCLTAVMSRFCDTSLPKGGRNYSSDLPQNKNEGTDMLVAEKVDPNGDRPASGTGLHRFPPMLWGELYFNLSPEASKLYDRKCEVKQ